MASWKDAIGKNRLYNEQYEDQNVIFWEVLEIKPEQLVKITFLSTNSENEQGIRIAVDAGNGYVETNNIKAKAFELWQSTAPKEVLCKCISPEGLLSIYNIWKEPGKHFKDSQGAFSGMIVEDRGAKHIYHCNDTKRTTVFDKLVFSIELV